MRRGGGVRRRGPGRIVLRRRLLGGRGGLGLARRADRRQRDGPVPAVVLLDRVGDLGGRQRVRVGARDALARRAHGLALEGVVLRGLALVRRRRGRRGRAGAAARLDLLEAEEDDRDVVAAARRVGGVDQALAERLERVGLLEQRAQLGLVDHRGQPVGAQQEEVARLGREDVDVDLDARLGPERARDHGALRVLLGLLLGQLAARDELARPASGPWSGGSARRRAAGRRASRRRGRSRPRRRRRRPPSSSCPCRGASRRSARARGCACWPAR